MKLFFKKNTIFRRFDKKLYRFIDLVDSTRNTIEIDNLEYKGGVHTIDT